MTEREGKHVADQTTPPPPAAERPDRLADASGPPPQGPEGGPAEPPSAGHDQRGGSPLGPGSGGFPSDAPFQWPDQPGSQHFGGSDDVTAEFDRSTASAPDWVPGPGDAPRPGAQDLGGPGEPYGPNPSPPPDRFGPPPGAAAGPAPQGAYPAGPGPSWQQPNAAAQQPAGGWPADDHGLPHAQGSAANWNYVDNIRSSELVPTRRTPPGRGWRKAVYLGSFKLINLGQSPDERYQGELETKIRSLLRGQYKIGVLGKGGVGKSTISASVGSVFAELRQDDRVVAIDADTGFGKLASRIDPSASGSYWELAADSELYTFSDIRSRVGSNKSGLFVLPGEAATARRRVLDAEIYRKATIKLDRHFTLSIVDCGSTLDSPVTREVLDDLDALIVVSSPWYDGASAAGQTLEWLANGGYTGLLHRTVVVVNDSDGHAAQRDVALLVERFGGRGQKVIEMPYDEHLRPGGVIDVKGELGRLTRRRLMEVAAACAEHFAATADRARGA
jgi:MinD-like ATPase involved in chromosome partitioning or flagellar assembly